ncbi:hypothetical protein WAI453_008229 [Rhynchosporium graminicola]
MSSSIFLAQSLEFRSVEQAPKSLEPDPLSLVYTFSELPRSSPQDAKNHGNPDKRIREKGKQIHALIALTKN